MPFRFVIAFLPRSKRLLISWLQSPSAVILELKKIKSVTISIVCPFIFHEVMGPDAMILVFWILSLNQLFHSPVSLSSRGSLVPLHFLPSGWYADKHIWGCWYFSQQSWFQLVLHPSQHPIPEFGASQAALVIKDPFANAVDARDVASTPGSWRFPGAEAGNPLWYSCLENSTGSGAHWLQSMEPQRVGHDEWLSTGDPSADL